MKYLKRFNSLVKEGMISDIDYFFDDLKHDGFFRKIYPLEDDNVLLRIHKPSKFIKKYLLDIRDQITSYKDLQHIRSSNSKIFRWSEVAEYISRYISEVDSSLVGSFEVKVITDYTGESILLSNEDIENKEFDKYAVYIDIVLKNIKFNYKRKV